MIPLWQPFWNLLILRFLMVSVFSSGIRSLILIYLNGWNISVSLSGASKQFFTHQNFAHSMARESPDLVSHLISSLSQQDIISVWRLLILSSRVIAKVISWNDYRKKKCKTLSSVNTHESIVRSWFLILVRAFRHFLSSSQRTATNDKKK